MHTSLYIINEYKKYRMEYKCSRERILFTLLIILVVLISTIFVIYFTNQNKVDNESSPISLLFLGDFMIGDSYQGPVSFPFNNIQPMLKNKTEIIVNLETAATDKKTTEYTDKSYVYKINSSILKEWKKNEITIVNLANNLYFTVLSHTC